MKGQTVSQILAAFHPDCTGRYISTVLQEKAVAFALENGISQIEVQAAEDNIIMQRVCLKWGFRDIDFKAYTGIDLYTAVLCRWPGDVHMTKRQQTGTVRNAGSW